jgi:tetratricopeptide (TPR) repeat protein
MILLHLFYSGVPRALDTPRMRLIARAACVVLFALVLAGAVSRGEEAATPKVELAPDPSTAAAHEGRGNVSIIHVSGTPETAAAAAPAGDPAATPHPDAATESTHAGAEPAPAPAAAPAEPAAHVAADDHAAAAEPLATHAEPAPESTTPTATAAHASEGPEAPASVAHDAPAPAHAETPPPAPPVHATPAVEAPSAHAAAPVAGHESRPAPAPVASGHGATSAAGDHARSQPVDDAAESGRRFWQAGDYVAAEKAFTRALTANVPVEQKRSLVLEMAGLYRGANQLTKAASVLEKFVKTFPNDREMPQVLLQLGAIYRDLGVYSMATARFFQVLNSTLRVSDEDIPEYRKLAMKARLEIAETYALQGNLTEAEKYFSRLQLLDLEPADRERVLLRAAQMQFTLKQWLAAEKALASFAADHPDSPHLAEMRYMRAKALEELGRKQEAVDEVVALLQMPVSGDTEVARSTAYWKRRCANELANNFYEQGDFLGALAVYQALARASMDPTWRWPAIYQIGLCFERMDMPQRAAEAYDAILVPANAPAPGSKLPEALLSLQDMARWRRSHLVWIEEKGRQLDSLAGDKPAS